VGRMRCGGCSQRARGGWRGVGGGAGGDLDGLAVGSLAEVDLVGDGGAAAKELDGVADALGEALEAELLLVRLARLRGVARHQPVEHDVVGECAVAIRLAGGVV
jgi:hypothetical protein